MLVSPDRSKPLAIFLFNTDVPFFGKKEEQFVGHFFSNLPRGIQLQHCLEICKITVYLRKHNQSLSDSQLWQETDCCNEVSCFFSFPHLLHAFSIPSLSPVFLFPSGSFVGTF